MAMWASQLMIKKYDAFVLVARGANSDITLSTPSEPSVELHEPSVASQQPAPTQRSATRQRLSILLW